jgi:hypothetical protein
VVEKEVNDRWNRSGSGTGKRVKRKESKEERKINIKVDNPNSRSSSRSRKMEENWNLQLDREFTQLSSHFTEMLKMTRVGSFFLLPNVQL